jgi:hypothetical protein
VLWTQKARACAGILYLFYIYAGSTLSELLLQSPRPRHRALKNTQRFSWVTNTGGKSGHHQPVLCIFLYFCRPSALSCSERRRAKCVRAPQSIIIITIIRRRRRASGQGQWPPPPPRIFLSLSLFGEPVCCCGFLSPALTTRIWLQQQQTPCFISRLLQCLQTNPCTSRAPRRISTRRALHLIPPRRAALAHSITHIERAINAPKKGKERGHLSHIYAHLSLSIVCCGDASRSIFQRNTCLRFYWS